MYLSIITLKQFSQVNTLVVITISRTLNNHKCYSFYIFSASNSHQGLSVFCNKMVHSRKYLELDYTWIFATAYVPGEHRIQITSF
jgi:hypothetical protein